MRTMKWMVLVLVTLCGVADIAEAGEKKPLKVYILAGQSNMQGHARERVLPALADDPATKDLYAKLVGEDGTPRVHTDVHMAAFSNVNKSGPLTVGFGGPLRDETKFGPELAFGATMQEALGEPILIIKTAWGGKSLSTDFRPPSAGAYVFPPETAANLEKQGKLEAETKKRNEQTGKFYRLMMEHVKTVLADPGKYCPAYDPEQGVELAGFVWFQGWNDMVDRNTYPTKGEGRFQAYTDVLCHFIRDVRKELEAPELPFVIGVLGVGGNPDKPNPFREAMAAPAEMEEFKDSVVAVQTAKYWDAKLGELADRGWKALNPRYDKEGKYAELREKVLPLKRELRAAKEIKDRKERADKEREIKERMDVILYTPEEKAYIKANQANQGYHYLGSAKILGRIGEAFAKALIELNKK